MDLSKLNTAAKVACIIDDDVERDEALCEVAQMQSAANDIDGMMTTINQIRYVDIRADAWRKTLDNVLARYDKNVTDIPNYNQWVHSVLSTTMEISNPVTRQNKFFPLLAFTISRFDKPTAMEFLSVAREEMNQIKNAFVRSLNMFAVCHHYQAIKEMDEASATLDLAQKGLENVQPIANQGHLVAMVALEYWKMKDYMSAFDCIGRMQSRKGQTYAYQHLAELLAMGGLFKDAQSILNQMDDGVAKEIGKRVVALGKQIYNMFPPEQRKAIVNFSELHSDDDNPNSPNGIQNDGEQESNESENSEDEADLLSDSEGLKKLLSGLNLDTNSVDVHIGVQIVNIDGNKISDFDDEDSEFEIPDDEDDDDDDDEDDDEDDEEYSDFRFNKEDENAMDMMEPFRTIRELKANHFPGGPDDIRKEKIDDFNTKVEDLGFDAAWQDLLEQGEYHFAVDRMLSQFVTENKSELTFGPENRVEKHKNPFSSPLSE